ncbi:putative Spermidine/putrescine ABC transporter (permease protein) [Bradyrhizobium sp. ORS 375]|uniref:ABC transporter permease n=1 Tax=Bradyrhizobium sp. (strain ORS 375) TaxID=566679 RepID=UPI00024068D1|nr:ABC transporter permease [Bradyrhizobium sp. ORS 375]CCD91320.1 putative Spermidine/putrescine ABC transporter (permease protein) [Bradyrhizobium sp. ORS 375]
MLSFFVVPLVTMMKTAVSDPVATEALPRTARALSGWDRTGTPSASAQAAFADDIRALKNDEQFGDLVRRLNSAQSGFRSLLGKTRRALDGSGAVDLASIDPRWSETSYWTTIAEAVASPWTDKNLLAAVDLERNASGSIAAMPEGASANRLIMIRTFITSAMVTLACILIGLPYAMVAASVEGWRRQVLLGAVLLPLWTSLLVRTAAWYVVLQDNGLINATLKGLGLTSSPVPLMFNRLGVVIAMTHVLLPFMVLPIFSVLIAIPRNLMPAAASLGAHPLRAFFHVLLPLSMRGVVSGALLVFMAALGYYITPALIGGANDQMISSVIAYYATGAANWGMAGALGLVLLAMTILLYAIYMRLTVEEQRA